MSASDSIPDSPGNDVMGSDVQWAIGALVIGVVMLLAAPITCILSAEIWAHADRSPNTVILFAWLARAAVCIAALTLGLGLVFGRNALRFANAYRRPTGLAVAGLYLSAVASILWVITSIALLSTTESLLHWYGR
jgi:hypothetical protein